MARNLIRIQTSILHSGRGNMEGTAPEQKTHRTLHSTVGGKFNTWNIERGLATGSGWKGMGRQTTAAPVLSNSLPLSCCNSWEWPTRSHRFHPRISSGQLFAIPHSDCLRDRGVAMCACVSPWRWLPHRTAQLAPGNEAARLRLGSSTLNKAVTLQPAHSVSGTLLTSWPIEKPLSYESWW